MIKVLIGLMLLVVTSTAFCDEGFFSPGQIQTDFSIPDRQSSALFVEQMNPNLGKWAQVGNAFVVTQSGYILTNYHIAQVCLRSNWPYYQTKYQDLTAVYRQGFYSADTEGVPCSALRVTNDPHSQERYAVRLIALPPIAEEASAPPSLREASGPYYDFAVLKITPVTDKKPLDFSWLPLKKSVSSDLQVGAKVYLLGYPAPTARQQASSLVQQGSYTDVKSGDYRVATGNILEVLPEYYYQSNKDMFIYTSTDGGAGSSGSALLNAEGTLIGLILGSGDAKSTISQSQCIPKYSYCGGVSLYMKVDHILDVIEQNFGGLVPEIEAPVKQAVRGSRPLL